MAIGPIGNAIYVNQQTASVASTQGNHNNRVDFQNMVAGAAANEKDEQVIEVRPTEENLEINDEREHQREEADQESKRSSKKPDEEEEHEDEQEPLTPYKLDIKV